MTEVERQKIEQSFKSKIFMWRNAVHRVWVGHLAWIQNAVKVRANHASESKWSGYKIAMQSHDMKGDYQGQRSTAFGYIIPWICLMVVILSGCRATVETNIRPEISRNMADASLSRDDIRKIRKQKRHISSVFERVRRLEAWGRKHPERLVDISALINRRAVRETNIQEQLGLALVSSRLAWKSLEQSGVPPSKWLQQPGTSFALENYNNASKIFINAQAAQIAKGTTESVMTPNGEILVDVKFSKSAGSTGYFDKLIPSDRIKVRGFRSRAIQKGIGVPLVGIRERRPGREQELQLQPPRRNIAMALTGLIEFPKGNSRSSRATVVLQNPVFDNTLAVRGAEFTVPLAADFTAPLALTLGGVNDLLLGIRNLLNVHAGQEIGGIYAAEPFDPNRIPVLLIHGLSSTPVIWRDVVSQAMLDPEIRKNYQFLYAFYASGVPIVQSAALIRREIREIRKRYDPSGRSRSSRHMVIIGHSMGGIITRILTTNVGDELWNRVAKVPFDQVKLDEADRDKLQDMLFWKPLHGVDRVVFIATPHRGSYMADASFAHLGQRLIRFPGDMMNFQVRLFRNLYDVIQGDFASAGRVTGVSNLSPSSPIYSALDMAPFSKGLPIHSIIGDRGRQNSPRSSDGVVAYWSSHLPFANSELIVPSGHNAQANPQTELEIQRILIKNLKKPLQRK